MKWTIEPTRRCQEDLRAYLESHPKEMVVLMANLFRYEQLLNESRGETRPQLEGLSELEMGIISIGQLSGSIPHVLLAFMYPDASQKLATLIKIGKVLDRDADLEYAKKCVLAYLN